MAVLPESGTAPMQTPGRQPSRTWHIDQETARIRGEADGLEAVRQAVEIILNVERFSWQIYRPYSGMQRAGLIGGAPGYVTAELLRRLQEALLADDRVLGISGFDYGIEGDTLTAALSVSTVYGTVDAALEVTI